MITDAYAGNRSVMRGLGWGDHKLLEEDGTVKWLHWEPLSWTATKTVSDDTAGHRPQAVKPPEADERPPRARFDDLAEADDDLPLRPRIAPGEPQREVEPPAEGTGTDDGSGDGAH